MEESISPTPTTTNPSSSVPAVRSEEGRSDRNTTDTTSRMSSSMTELQQPQEEESSSSDLFEFRTREGTWRRALDHYQQFRYKCGKIVNNKRVQLFIVSLIAINAIMMGIGTFDFVTENPNVDHAFEVVDKTFLVIFTIELAMQFIFYGWRLVLDGWLLFDLIIIVTSWSFSQVQIVRAFRIFRALRLITRIKVMKNLVLGKSSFMTQS